MVLLRAYTGELPPPSDIRRRYFVGTHGYDRNDSWMHGTLPLSPQEFTASLWSDLQELRDAVLMSGRARPWQTTRKLLDGLKGNLPDEELAAIKRYTC